MEVTKVLHMNGGIGETSYAKNSLLQGSIEEEKVDSFNIPAYNPSPEEVIYIVDKEGSFIINVLETLEIHRNSSSDEKYSMVQSFRCVAEPLLDRHFGHGELNMDQVFHIYNEIFVSDCKAKEKIMFVNVTVSLAKKNATS
ncbi:hypothetical protein CQW23_12969 [Capsicum baccatum]|uniref:Salicylate carboxymethyltransferase n=1 Tax=Capsicum baccatum TaxID=33114 RepID=A0A2G2WU90_CAPBA|nr:hypothetical protein CQW23_12969 [Capsicum baccatum]